MLPFNSDKSNCTGCAACYSVCPTRCISMKPDDEGFLYPDVNDNCINCRLCEKVCPTFLPKQENKIQQKALAAVTKDMNIWRRSASGGAFSEICRLWAKENTLIVGAAWNGLNVHHIGVTGYDNITPLCKSKYVSSAIEDTFIEIKNTLKTGRTVIFSGCPCQVAGLKVFLGKDYDNLLTIDLICHGQGSPTVFEACIRNMSNFLREDILSYQFRAKRKRYEDDYISCVKTNKHSYYITKDPYMQLFFSQNVLRPSCGENCKYRDVRRPGDLTIADLKGLTQMFPDLIYPRKNWSTIICNTKKGEKCFEKLSATMETRPITIDNVIKYNPLFAQQTWFSKDRNSFFTDFIADEKTAISKWTVPLTIYKPSLKKVVLSVIPVGIIKFIYRFFK